MQKLELKVPPVVQVAILAAAIWLIAEAFPSWAYAFPGQSLVAACLAAMGIAFGFAGIAAFRRAHTTVDPVHPAKAGSLVATGVYRISRNPMYLGMLLLLAAWSVFVANLLAPAALPVFVLYMNRFQIIPEERALRAKFDGEFETYEKSVRRWL